MRWRGDDCAATAENASKKPSPDKAGGAASRDVHTLKIGGRLFPLVVERGEHGDQIDTEALDDRDNGERDACSDQAIFNGGGAGFVSQEFKKNSLQFRILSGCAASPMRTNAPPEPKVA
jgi:hypothetical protein